MNIDNELPRIASVTVEAPMTLRITWKGRQPVSVINMSRWIATGGDIIAPLRDPRVFARAAISSGGAAVSWDGGKGDLAIDAMHLKKMAQEA